MAGNKEMGKDEQRFGNVGGANPASNSEIIPEKNLNEQGNPDRLPSDPEETPSRQNPEEHREGRRHENRENPRSDHPTGHLGYNRTHNKDVISPVEEGSDKI